MGALYHKLQAQSIVPEDGRDHRPKHVELIGIITKPLLLHLVGVYIIYILRNILATAFLLSHFRFSVERYAYMILETISILFFTFLILLKADRLYQWKAQVSLHYLALKGTAVTPIFDEIYVQAER